MKKLDGKIADVTGASNRVVNEITSAGGKAISVREASRTTIAVQTNVTKKLILQH